MRRIHAAKVQHNGRKAARLQKQIRRAQSLIESRPRLFFVLPAIHSRLARAVATTHPEQLPEPHTTGRGRFRIEGIVGINPGADLPCCHPARHKSQRQTGSPRALRPHQFADRAHRQSAFEQLIDRRNSRRGNLANRPRDTGSAPPESGLRGRPQSGCGVRRRWPYIRLIFAYDSPDFPRLSNATSGPSRLFWRQHVWPLCPKIRARAFG